MTTTHSPRPPPPPSRDSHAVDLIPLLETPASSALNTLKPQPDQQDHDQQEPRAKLSTAQVTVDVREPQPARQNSPGSLASTSNNTITMGMTTTTTPPPLERRPSTPRAQTDPSYESLPTHHPRPRNRSPYSRSHLRSNSGSGAPAAPPMMRAHSLPAAISSSNFLALSPSPVPGRSSSPLRSPKRTRSPRSQPSFYEESYSQSGAPSVCDISEDAELEITPKAGIQQPSPISSLYSSTGSLSRRRRPASPLHQVAFGGHVSAPTVRTPTSASSSPLLNATKFNEPFPALASHYPSSHASSSIPSTPTSMRSRSPSISSLETIPDTPDAEAEAIEADRIARLEAAANQEKEGAEGIRRSSLDVPSGTTRVLGFGKRDSRKRWSVCGAERRGDLDLETIWED